MQLICLFLTNRHPDEWDLSELNSLLLPIIPLADDYQGKP